MEIRNITTFLKVAELRNFSRAANHLGYSQSTVTVQIKQLEEELGTLLFERFGKQVQLTEYGKQFINYATDILRTVHAAKSLASMDDDPKGTLRIGVIESLSSSILPAILMNFQRLYPHVETRVVTGLNTDMYELVQRNEVDLIFFLDQKIYHPEWIKVIERPEPIVFVASCKHPLAHAKKIQIERLLQEQLVLTEKGYSYRYDLEQFLAAKGYELRPVLEIGNTDVILKFLLSNIGISFLPYFVVRQLVESGELSIIHLDNISIQMWSQLAYHKNKLVTPQMKKFMDLMIKHTST